MLTSMASIPTHKHMKTDNWFLTSVEVKKFPEIRNPKTGEMKVTKFPRTFGYYHDYADALAAVRENRCNMHECLYQYLVMECIGEGVHALREKEEWFKWSGKKWKPCKKPEWAWGMVNWAVG